MRNISIAKKHLKASNAYFEYPEKEKHNEQQAAEAKFCLECCNTAKHKKCSGMCEEFRQFKKTLKIADKRIENGRK